MAHNSKSSYGDRLKDSLQRSLEKNGGTIAINDTPSFPLAMNAPMPEGHAYGNGHLSFRFSDLSCHDLRGFEMSTAAGTGDAEILQLSFPQLSIRGRYAIESKEAQEIDLDLAGTMLPYDYDYKNPQAAGADDGGDGTFTDEQKAQYLDQARDNRTRLMETANGQKMMDMYNNHEEVYNEIFQNSAQTRYTWKAGGATAEMATDTANADKSNTVVNDPAKQYGAGTFQNTYNGNSFTQQNNIIAGCITASGWNPWSGTDLPENKYTDAALAAMNFQKMVGTTGNTDANVNTMTPGEVHDSVNGFTGAPPATTLAELQNRAEQTMGNGGAPAAEALRNGWTVFDEKSRLQFRNMLTERWAERQASQKQTASVLWEGDCSAEIMNAKAVFTIDRNTATVLDSSLVLPAFEFEMEDAHWTEPSASLVRERLAQVYFVRSLLHSQIKNALKNTLDQAAATAAGRA